MNKTGNLKMLREVPCSKSWPDSESSLLLRNVYTRSSWAVTILLCCCTSVTRSEPALLRHY